MKIKIFQLSIACLLGVMLSGQNAYYDAQALAKLSTYYDAAQKKNIISSIDEAKAHAILQNYTLKDMSAPELVAEFQGNPFIGLPATHTMSSTPVKAAIGQGLSSLGNLNVTNFAVGLSDFLIERGKAELNVAFFQKLENWLDANPEAYVLFPTTKKYLSNIMSYEYTVMINTLKESFQRDLSDLPTNLPKLFNYPPYDSYVASHPEILMAMESLIAVENNYKGDPNDLLTSLYSIPSLNPSSDSPLNFWQKNYKNSLVALNILSESLRSKEPEKIWIKSQEFQQNILADSIANSFYIGLLYQHLKNKQVRFYQSNESVVWAADTIKSKARIIAGANVLAQQFVNNAQVVARTIDEINATARRGDNINRDQIYTYVNVSLDLVEYSNEVYKFATGEQLLNPSYMELGRSGNDLFLTVASKQYGSAIMETVNLLKDVRDLLGKGIKNEITGVNREITILKQRDEDKSKIKGLRKQVNTLQKDLDTLQKDMDDRLDKLIRFGTFMANVVQAESADAVQAAIETAALPVGSSSMKKYSNFDIAVQAYLGAAWHTGFEGDEIAGSSWFNGSSFFAPVGVGVTFPGFGKAGSLGVFFSGIDVGAVVQYRLENPNSDPKEIQEIKLGYLVSPGVYGVYGFPFNWPLSVGFGGQYGPGLTTITDESNIVIDPSWRYNLFLAIDIPVFTIFNTEKHKLK